ncbi:hypothetical protein BIWAKO_05786 [Bosea sp. BIWAKO-01]|nr:hypothetical protein BIWAKO_05786 [Bosea sp. BIWAKO-01]
MALRKAARSVLHENAPHALTGHVRQDMVIDQRDLCALPAPGRVMRQGRPRQKGRQHDRRP